MKLMQLIINKTYNLTLTIDAETSPENTDKNQENDGVQKKPLQIHVVKNIIYDPTQILTSQIHTDIENRTLTRL